MDLSHICRGLRECKLDEIEKKRQLLRANNHELRQLERQLQFAVVSKELSEQQQKRIQQREEDFRKQSEENAKFTEECEIYRKSMLQQEEQKKKKKKEFLEVLKSQINDLQQNRRREFEKIKEDCDGMHNLYQIQADENAKLEEMKMIRENYKADLEEAIQNKKLKLQFEQQRTNEELERNLAYQKNCDNLKSNMEEISKRIKMEKEALRERMGQHLATVKQEKERREDLFLSLSLEERKSRDDESYKKAVMKRIKERDEFRVGLENFCIENKYLKEKKFQEEENKFREEQLRYLQERDKIDQLSDEKRLRKKMEHNKALRELIEIRRYQKATAIAERIAEFNKLLNDTQKSEQLIEEERCRMLSAVPKELLPYLPPSVLRLSHQELNSLTEKC